MAVFEQTKEDMMPKHTYSKFLQDFFSSLYETRDEIYMSDVIFEIHSNESDMIAEKIYGIRMCFACQSKVFKNILFENINKNGTSSSNNYDNNKKLLVIINDIDINTFKWLKKYCYSINPKININNIISIIKMADKYKIEALYEDCINFIINNLINPQQVDQLVQLFIQLQKFNLNDALKFILNYTKANAKEDTLKSILECNLISQIRLEFIEKLRSDDLQH